MQNLKIAIEKLQMQNCKCKITNAKLQMHKCNAKLQMQNYKWKIAKAKLQMQNFKCKIVDVELQMQNCKYKIENASFSSIVDQTCLIHSLLGFCSQLGCRRQWETNCPSNDIESFQISPLWACERKCANKGSCKGN